MPPRLKFPLCALFMGAVLVSALADPDQAQLHDGSVLLGQLAGMEAGFVLLRMPTEQGQATRRLQPSQIKRLVFAEETAVSDETSGAVGDLQLRDLESRAQRRASYLGLLSPADESLLPDLLDAYLERERNLEALAYAKLWLPKSTHQSNRLRLAEQLIAATLAANLPQEAAIFARDWLDLDPQLSYSALAAHALAEERLAYGRYEEALWIALGPIAQRANPAPRYLDRCYQSAIAASKALGYADYARQLAIERATPDSRHSPRLDPLDSLADETSSPPAAQFLPSLQSENLDFPQLLKASLIHDTP